MGNFNVIKIQFPIGLIIHSREAGLFLSPSNMVVVSVAMSGALVNVVDNKLDY